jgi:hypothetical protein
MARSELVDDELWVLVKSCYRIPRHSGQGAPELATEQRSRRSYWC